MENVNILIVEDDLSFASLLQERLVLLGYSSYDIVSIDAIADAIAVKVEFTPDVILLDLNIRDSSGIATYDRIQAVFDGATIVNIQVADEDVDTSYVLADTVSSPNPSSLRSPGCATINANGTYFVRAVLKGAGKNTSITAVTT